MKVDSDIFIKGVALLFSFVGIVGIGAVSAYKIKEHSRELSDIWERIEPKRIDLRLVTSKELDLRLKVCALFHSQTTEHIRKSIEKIEETLTEGEKQRNAARIRHQERDDQLLILTHAVEKLVEKLP